MNIEHFLAEPGKFKSLNRFPTSADHGITDKEDGADFMKEYMETIQELQDRLYADNRFSFLLIFQAMDAAGKDSTIKNVMSGLNPQGCQVYSFKQPSQEELDHDFLWRTTKCLPERGRIGIFNRSYYEEVLVVRVHPEIILKQGIPEINNVDQVDDGFWKGRYNSINDFEKHLVRNGTQVIKFFLHVSKEEQADRFLKRIRKPEKNWKFAYADLNERKHWDKYQEAYEEMIEETSTEEAPWYIIPADRKWYMHMAVAQVFLKRMSDLNLQYPSLTEQNKADLKKGLDELEKELGIESNP
jgi:PPK2 family polyphosphate:nucleotide phosphotransferase